MIEVKIDGRTTALRPGEGISIQRNIPWFTNDNIQGDVTYPIKFADDPINDATFKHARQFRLANRQIKYPNAAIYFKGNLILSGTLILTEFFEGYEGIFTAMIFGIEFQGLTLKDVKWPQQFPISSTPAGVAAWCNSNHPDLGIYFPEIKIKDFYSGKNPAFRGIVNYKGTAPNNQVNSSLSNRYSFLPVFSFAYIVQKIAEHLRYTAHGHLFEYPFNQLLFPSNVPLDEASGDNKPGQGNNTTSRKVFGKVNILFDTVSGLMNNTTPNVPNGYVVDLNGLHKVTATLFIYMFNLLALGRSVIFRVESERGILATQEFDIPHNITTQCNVDTDLTLYQGERIWFTLEFRVSGELSSSFFGGSYFCSPIKVVNPTSDLTNRYKTVFNYITHMPDINVVDFVKFMRESFNMLITVDPIRKRIYFDFEELKFNQAPVVDLTSKVRHQLDSPYINQPKIDFSDKTGFEVKYKNPLAVGVYAHGETPEKYEFELSHLMSEFMADAETPAAYRFMFYDEEMKANSFITDFQESRVLRFCLPSAINAWQVISLALTGTSDNNLRVLFFQNTYIWRHFASQCTIELELSQQEFENIDFTRPVLIDFQKTIIKQLKTNYRDNISITEAVCFVL